MKVTVDRLGHLGDGIALVEGRSVFMSGVMPGEEVEGDLNGDRLTNVRIVTPSAQRVRPPCSHAKSCGGCLMQHASDEFVAQWKADIVAGALAGQGLSAAVLGIATSPAQSRRRATLAGRKTKGGALIGFHARASDVIVAVPNCQLLHPGLKDTFPALEALTKLGGSRTQELALSVTVSDAGPEVMVRGGKPLDAALRMDLARLAEAHGIARLTWEDEPVALRANPVQQFGKARVTPPAGAFLQATSHGEAALLSAVRRALGAQRKVVDLFAGCGTFALPLAEGSEVHAVEGDVAMTRAMDVAARTAGTRFPITTETRDLFRRPLEPDEFKGVTGVVIDPPRAGAEAQVAKLAAAKVSVIAMVSCNPATFARDARILVQAGYKLDWVAVVDQFRWSSHVELASRFVFGAAADGS